MLSDHYSIIKAIVQSEADNYLATIIKVEGSSYRKEGAMMYFAKEGQNRGLLTGGCVEADIWARIDQGLDDSSAYLTYDLRSEDDLTWGQGIGCDGKIHLLIEKITDDIKRKFTQIKEALDQGICVSYMRLLQDDFTLKKSYLVSTLNMYQQQALTASLIKEGNSLYFHQLFEPRPHLIIYGAGPDAFPFVSLAHKAGFRITLSDWREGYCNPLLFPEADNYVVLQPKQAMDTIQPTEHDYLVIMTHSYVKDKELLFTIINKKLTYLGILGSKKRTEKLLANVSIPEWIHYPAGLPIYSESPEEIAISMVAELIQVKNKRRKKKENVQ